MVYFDGRVIIGLVLITLLMACVSIAKRRWVLMFLFAGLFSLSMHIGVAALATKDKIEDQSASIADGSLHALSGFAALPSWVFSIWVSIGVACLVAAAVWWLLDRVGITGKISSTFSRSRGKKTSSADLDYGGTAVRP